MIEQAAHVLAGQIALQGPRRIRVSDARREVGDAAIHHALVAHGLAEIDALSVDGELYAAEHLQLEAGGGHHYARLELGARAEGETLLGEGFDVVGDDRRAAAPDRPKEIAVRHQAYALIPELVSRCAVRLDVVVRSPGLSHRGEQQLSGALRKALAEPEEKHAQ